MRVRSSTDGALTRRLAFALLAITASQAAVYVARPATSYRLLGIGEGPAAVGVVAACFALIPLFLAIPLGRVADRHPRFPALVLGCVIQAAASFVLAAGESVASLACGSALLGLGHLGIALAVQELVARESAPRHHDRHFGLLTAGVSLGQLIGPLVAGAVVVGSDLVGSTTRAMVAAAAVSVLALALALASHRERTLHVPGGERGRAPLRSIVATRGVPAAILGSIAVLSAADVFTAYLPVLGEQWGISPAAVGVLLALRAAASIGSRLGIDGIVARIGRVRLLWSSTAIAATAFAAMTLTHDLVLLGVLSLVGGFALGFGQPLSMTIVVQLVPARARATALGLRLTGNRAGQVVVPALAGAAAGAAGAVGVFWLTSGLLAVASATLWHDGEAFEEARATVEAGDAEQALEAAG